MKYKKLISNSIGIFLAGVFFTIPMFFTTWYNSPNRIKPNWDNNYSKKESLFEGKEVLLYKPYSGSYHIETITHIIDNKIYTEDYVIRKNKIYFGGDNNPKVFNIVNLEDQIFYSEDFILFLNVEFAENYFKKISKLQLAVDILKFNNNYNQKPLSNEDFNSIMNIINKYKY